MNARCLFTTLLVAAFVATSLTGCLQPPVKQHVDATSTDTAVSETDQVPDGTTNTEPADEVNETPDATPEAEVDQSETIEVEIDTTICKEVEPSFGVWYLFEDDYRFEDLPAQINGVPDTLTCQVQFVLDPLANTSGQLEATDLPMVYDFPDGWFIQFVMPHPFELHAEIYNQHGTKSRAYTYVR
ncbi:MAG: hypothetical protein HON29_04605 [Candidatus Magasanikbacteria bacterium]|jgi:hypothetical protein|nr:hypothetical protein [Candidatus Magasanikbacteria bacterium]